MEPGLGTVDVGVDLRRQAIGAEARLGCEYLAVGQRGLIEQGSHQMRGALVEASWTMGGSTCASWATSRGSGASPNA